MEGTDWTGLALTALILGLVNAFIRPVVKLLSLPVTILTLGLFTFIHADPRRPSVVLGGEFLRLLGELLVRHHQLFVILGLAAVDALRALRLSA